MSEYVTAQDIVIPAGTRVYPAPDSTRRHTPHGSVIVGHGDDAHSEWVMDLEDALEAGLILLSTDELARVDTMLDAFGEETDDPDEAVALVAPLPNGRWVTVDVTQFHTTRIH